MTRTALVEYEKVLHQAKKSNNFYYDFKNNCTAYAIQESVIELMRFVFEKVLEWSPEQVADYLSYRLLEKLHLAIVFDNYIIYPCEIDKGDRDRNRTSPHLCDMSYLLHLLYPSIYPYRYVDAVIRTYNRAKMFCQKGITRQQWVYPAAMFSDEKGVERAILCLRYALKKSKIKTLSIEKMYELFADPDEGMNFLKEIGLNVVCKTLFDSPLDFLHAALPTKYQMVSLYEKYSKEQSKVSGKERLTL